ncbi:hypothetical protein [Streptomyces sp. RKAG290]|nr:hypothetical protein [Streptomyces sp. RKAG290]
MAQRLPYGTTPRYQNSSTATVACSIDHTQTTRTLPATSGPAN